MKDLLEVLIISTDFREIFPPVILPSSCCATRSQSLRCRLSLMLLCLAWVTPPESHWSCHGIRGSCHVMTLEARVIIYKVSCVTAASLLPRFKWLVTTMQLIEMGVDHWPRAGHNLSANVGKICFRKPKLFLFSICINMTNDPWEILDAHHCSFLYFLQVFLQVKFKTWNAAINFWKSTSQSYEYLKFGNICERISFSLDNQILIFWFWSAILRKVKVGVRIFWKSERWFST